MRRRWVRERHKCLPHRVVRWRTASAPAAAAGDTVRGADSCDGDIWAAVNRAAATLNGGWVEEVNVGSGARSRLDRHGTGAATAIAVSGAGVGGHGVLSQPAPERAPLQREDVPQGNGAAGGRGGGGAPRSRLPLQCERERGGGRVRPTGVPAPDLTRIFNTSSTGSFWGEGEIYLLREGGGGWGVRRRHRCSARRSCSPADSESTSAGRPRLCHVRRYRRRCPPARKLWQLLSRLPARRLCRSFCRRPLFSLSPQRGSQMGGTHSPSRPDATAAQERKRAKVVGEGKGSRRCSTDLSSRLISEAPM